MESLAMRIRAKELEEKVSTKKCVHCHQKLGKKRQGCEEIHFDCFRANIHIKTA